MSSVQQIVVFRSQDNEFAFDIMGVREIIRFTKITNVAKSADYIVGVVNLRGNVLPVLDFREMIGEKKTELDKSKRIIFIELDDFKVGILVDSVREVLRVKEDDFQEIHGSDKVSGKMIKLDSGERIISFVDIVHLKDSILSGEKTNIVIGENVSDEDAQTVVNSEAS